MPSALSIFQNIDDAIRGKQADHPGFGRGYDLQGDIAHGASSNIAPMQGMRDLFFQRKRNRKNFEKILVAFDRWLDLPTMHNEPCSTFVYGHWLMTLYQCLYVIAQVEGHSTMAEKARRHMRNFRIMAAASCGWEKLDGQWFPTMVGKRCWVAKRPRKSYTYWHQSGPNKGKWRRPYSLDTSGLSWHINAPLGARAGLRRHKISHALADTFSNVDQWGCPQSDREVLLALIALRSQPSSGQWTNDYLPYIERSLAEGPRFYHTFQVLRTTEAVAYVYAGPGSKSTCAQYGKVWYKNGRPNDELWKGLEYWEVDPHIGWITTNPPRRKAGEPAHARFEERSDGHYIVAANNDGDYYHCGLRKHIDGQIELLVPGERVLQIDLKKSGVTIVHPKPAGTGKPSDGKDDEPSGCLGRLPFFN